MMAGSVIRRIFVAALLGGAIGGGALAVCYHFLLVPMILEAETFETTGADEGGSHGHTQGHGEEGAEAWAPEDGAERTFYTVVTSVAAGIGFALLLVGCYALRGRVGWRQGLVWGLAGFAAFNVAPALGLPPELPGTEAAALGARQFWWIATVVLTAGGFATFAFAPRYFKALGVVPLALPHILGAPHPEQHGGLAPAELEQAFIYMSLLVNGVFWIILGAATAYFFSRRHAGDAA